MLRKNNFWIWKVIFHSIYLNPSGSTMMNPIISANIWVLLKALLPWQKKSHMYLQEWQEYQEMKCSWLKTMVKSKPSSLYPQSMMMLAVFINIFIICLKGSIFDVVKIYGHNNGSETFNWKKIFWVSIVHPFFY